MPHWQIVEIEHQRTPLKYSVAQRILNALYVSPHWLISGGVLRNSRAPMPSNKELNIPENTLFSQVYDRLDEFEVDPESSQEFKPLENDIWKRTQAEIWFMGAMERWLHYLPDDAVDQFVNDLHAAGEDIFQASPKDSDGATDKRLKGSEYNLPLHVRDRVFRPGSVEAIREFLKNKVEQDKDICLPDFAMQKPAHSLLGDLLKRITSVCKKGSTKVDLAEYLSRMRGREISPQQVNQWTSGKVVPGGEITLHMLAWVALQETKHKGSGSGSTRPEPKQTRKRKST